MVNIDLAYKGQSWPTHFQNIFSVVRPTTPSSQMENADPPRSKDRKKLIRLWWRT